MRPCARLGCCVTGLNLDVKRVSSKCKKFFHIVVLLFEHKSVTASDLLLNLSHPLVNRRSHLLGHVCAEVAEPRFLGEDSGV